ncbi:MAG: O-antigen ligase family protein [candidate division KSB1 bacterium]|nr:O-antigen ligase family protein [candidate division KSB1 bacterium]
MSGALLVILIIWDRHWAFYKKFFASLAILTFVISAIVANSRGPLFSLLLIAAFFLARRVFLRPRIRYLFVGLGIIALLAVIIALLPENLVSRYDIGSTVSGPSVVQPENTVAMRLKFWQTSLNMATESPLRFFLGHGIGAFGKKWYHTDTRWYPHNIFLEIFSEQGAIGVLAFYPLSRSSCSGA